jgi:hypothetical protein
LAKTTKPRNAPDSTLRNTQASGKRLTALEKKVSTLKAKVRDLESDVRYLFTVMDGPSENV